MQNVFLSSVGANAASYVQPEPAQATFTKPAVASDPDSDGDSDKVGADVKG
jgi:hypothetical protein